MSEFQLDTSGVVRVLEDDTGGAKTYALYKWHNLSPFAQGYVKAAFASLSPRGYRYETGSSAAEYRRWSFSDLAPATLAAMLKDCEAFQARCGQHMTAGHGADFWVGRQAGRFDPSVPPVTLSLGEDGLIHQQKAQPDVD